MRLFIFFMLLISQLVFGDNALLLKNQQPNWRPDIVEVYPNGAPLRVEFSAPIPKSKALEKVKEKLYTPVGSVARESDLKEGIRHGVTIIYYPSEKIETIAFYENGKLEGSFRTFDEQGVLRNKYNYRNDLLNGSYELFSSKGSLFEKGTYVNGKKEGESSFFSETGELVKKEQYLHGILHGELTEYYPNGNLSGLWNYYQGVLHGNQKTVAAIKYSPQRKIVEEQDFRMGQPWGWHRKYKEGELISEDYVTEIQPLKEIFNSTDIEVQQTHNQSDIIETAPKKPIRNGKYETFYDNGAKRSLIEYKDNVLHGKKMLWDPEGEVYEEANYVNGDLEGRYRHREMDGSDRLAHYKDNQLHGIFEVTHPPHDFFGKLKALECRYEEGLLEGDLIEYNIAGTKISQIPYKQGKREGKALYFNEKGILFRTVVFEDDRLHGKLEEYFPNGALKLEVLYRDGHKEGPETHYFNHGAIRSVTHYQNGLQNGESKEWNNAGQLIYEGNFIAGQRQGIFRRFDEQGKITKEKKYE